MDSVKAQCNEWDETDGNYENHGDEEFSKRFVREAAKMIKDKRPIKLMWPILTNESGYNCKQLWDQMYNSTIEKLPSLLAANDLLKHISPSMKLSATEWMLFDLVLVHESINVTNFNKLPQCMNELYEQVQTYKVESLARDELAAAWIQITLNYNKRGRQCSPMLLQLRWYQLKEMSRQQVYNPDPKQDNTVTKLLHSIAIKYQKIITRPFPKWKALIKEKRIILPEHFIEILKRENKWKEIEAHDDWYLKINKKIINFSNKGNLETNTVGATVESKREIKAPSEFDSITKGTLKGNYTPLNAVKKKLKSASRKKNGSINLDFVNEIDKILQETTDLLRTEDGVKKDIVVRRKFKKDAISRKREMVNRKNISMIDTEISDDGTDSEVNAKKIKRQKIARSGYNNDDNLKEDYGDMDPKLLMKVIISTKKLDSMKIFKNTDYNYVSDKKVIECATLESKLILKPMLKDKDKILRKNISGHKINNVRLDGDLTRNASEKLQNKIKSTNRLFHKPKNRKYNQIQLSKNPDFNSHLKMLTPDFFSSTRNKGLLKECKPLTVDLIKEFEANLINGTMYVKYFKSAKAAKSIENYQVAVPPLETSDQKIERDFEFTVTNTNNILAEQKHDNHLNNTSNNLAKQKHDNQVDDNQSEQKYVSPLSAPFESRQVSSQDSIQSRGEKRKINLPNIDQVRESNQILLTAEVTPIRNDSTFNNSNLQIDVLTFEKLIIVQSSDVESPIKKRPPKSGMLADTNILDEEPRKESNETRSDKDQDDSSVTLSNTFEPV